jgi:hypothetical protein
LDIHLEYWPIFTLPNIDPCKWIAISITKICRNLGIKRSKSLTRLMAHAGKPRHFAARRSNISFPAVGWISVPLLPELTHWHMGGLVSCGCVEISCPRIISKSIS